MGFCNCSMFRCALLCVHSSFAIISMGKSELVALLCLSSWCLLIVVRLFLTMSWVVYSLRLVFPDHTQLIFLILTKKLIKGQPPPECTKYAGLILIKMFRILNGEPPPECTKYTGLYLSKCSTHLKVNHCLNVQNIQVKNLSKCRGYLKVNQRLNAQNIQAYTYQNVHILIKMFKIIKGEQTPECTKYTG